MKVRSFFGLAGAGLVLSLAASCSDDDGDGNGSLGGSAGTAGSAGTGGSAGSAGTGGSAGSAGAAGTAGASGQTGSLSFADDVLPILQAECGECHAEFVPFASNDEEEAYEVAIEETNYAGTDQPRYDAMLQRLEDGTMPPECAGGTPGSSAECISQDDYETIQDWANGGDPPPP